MQVPFVRSSGGQTGGAVWWRAGLLGIVVLAVLVGLFFAGRWGYDAFTSDDTPQQTAGSGQSSQKAGTAGEPKSGNKSGDLKVSTSPPKGSHETSGTLVNTGPGDTVALFAGTVVLSAVAYQITLRRRRTE